MGEQQTATVCQSILHEDEAMARWLQHNLSSVGNRRYQHYRNWMPINLNTHAIDQNETTYQLRGIAQGHRRRDPATY
ncbi:hypothetical protein KDI_06760 [Dictyobacter arantiisoli]|uniref:Uncharacterized protein n=1 Tax=Dictyobacter arantiisoli TaxID=2014874 RepID=A0A5A5T6T4_9CHLR|nr:hypothetical protein KDI_06760 [Dictyobacter arantiisoli]